MIARYFLTLGLFLLIDSALAQCPYGIPNNSGCVPPDAWPQNQPGQAAQSQSYWVKTWGAFAKGSGVLGVSTGFDKKRQAEKAAINDCRVRGGSSCKVTLTYFNQCAAYAAAQRGSGSASGPDLEETQSRAMDICQKMSDGLDCKVIYSNCTEPYLVK